MDILFLDDSVQQGLRGGMGELVAGGGVMFEETALKPLEQRIEEIGKPYGIPERCELKWSPPKGNWIRDNLKGEDRTNCYRQVLEAAKEAGGRAVVVVFDTGRTTLQGTRALRLALDYVFDRATMHLEDVHRLGLIVADRPGGGAKEEAALLEDVLTTILEGTEFVPPKQIPMNILTTSSHLVRHLQIADLVVGVTTSTVAWGGQGTNWAEPLFPVVKEMFLRNAYGYVGGTGLKLFPDLLRNLYHWVLGEDAYGRSGSGYTLPWWAWPYFYDGFNLERGSGPKEMH